MKILNVRMGFATNSSSTHSLIFLPGEKDKDCYTQEFGWNNFTAASPKARQAYLAQTLRSNLYDVADSYKKAIIRDWLGVQYDESGYVDHQSVWTLPLEWEGKGIHRVFFEEFKHFIMQDGMVILGGNDNSEGDHYLLSKATRIFKARAFQELYRKPVARKDRDYWTLFDRSTGTKIRLSFDFEATTPEKATVPELVDIKITDYCPFECSFCYQNSTRNGIHGDEASILTFIRSLGDLQVFEVALGGGEPTLHPRLKYILETARVYNIVPNITTKRLGWLNDPETRSWMMKYCGGIGFSPTRSQDIKDLAKLLDRHKISKNKFNIQCVVGSHPVRTTLAWMRLAHENDLTVTLLGWKSSGRGGTAKQYGKGKWGKMLGDYLMECRTGRTGIDTVMANKYSELWESMKVPSWCYTKQEGKFSMYYDALSRKMGPSSFCSPEEMVDVPVGLCGEKLDNAIKSSFARW